MQKAKTKKKARLAWTDDEVNPLKKLYPDNSARDIANELERTVSAAKVKAHRLGLTEKPCSWSKRELNLLKRLYPSKMAREIAGQIGRSERATRSKIFRLGLQKRLKYEECHRVVNGAKEKLCGDCKTWKRESQFDKDPSTKDGLRWQCKECGSKYGRKRYERIRKPGRRNLRY